MAALKRFISKLENEDYPSSSYSTPREVRVDCGI
jgi:hypothetical protein